MNKAGRLTTVLGWRGLKRVGDGHGLGEWVAKGLTMLTLSVLTQGADSGRTVSKRNVRAGLVFLRGQQKGEICQGGARVGRVLLAGNSEEVFISLLILWVYLGPEVCGHCRDAQKEAHLQS